MKPIIPDFDNASGSPLYIQLYNYLKKEITEGRITVSENSGKKSVYKHHNCGNGI